MQLTSNEKISKYTNQRGYVLYYKFNELPRDLKKLPIKITFISHKLKAVFFYTSEKLEQKINEQIKHYNGAVYIERSFLFDETLNF